jgi:hypothetical protein
MTGGKGRLFGRKADGLEKVEGCMIDNMVDSGPAKGLYCNIRSLPS